MRPPLTDRRQFIEQQLFEVQIRLERARNELEIAELQLGELRAHEHAASVRLGASPTPLADRECWVARERSAQMASSADEARQRVEVLEARKDDLLTKLVG